MRQFISKALCGFIFVLLGCAGPTDVSKPTPQNIEQSKTISGDGYLVLSIEVIRPAGIMQSIDFFSGSSNFVLMIRKTDKSSSFRFNYVAGGMLPSPNDFKNENSHGTVLVKKLPSGQYEIHKYRVEWSAGMLGGFERAKEPFSIPFSITPGHATYLGNFAADRVEGKNLFGQNVSAGTFFIVRDKLVRDERIAHSKESSLGPLVSQIPDAAALKIPAFVPPKQ